MMSLLNYGLSILLCIPCIVDIWLPGKTIKNIVERGVRRVVELDVLNPVIIELLSTDVYELSERYTQQPFYLNNRRTIGRAIGDVTIKLEDI